MCVIITIEDGKFPTLKTLKSAEELNSHGGSIAWIQDGKNHFHKGLKAKQINKMIQKRLIPHKVKTAIIHFRIASIGAVKQKLCHPFVIDSNASYDLKGDNLNESLLFHNGTWSEYETHLIQSIKGKKVKIPSGMYSDSRIMAFLSHELGIDKAMSLVDGWNKVAILDKDKGIIKFGEHWDKVDGNLCSNNYFVKTQNNYYNNGFSYFENSAYNSAENIKTRVCYSKSDEKLFDNLAKIMTEIEIEDYIDSGYTLEMIEHLYKEECQIYGNPYFKY